MTHHSLRIALLSATAVLLTSAARAQDSSYAIVHSDSVLPGVANAWQNRVAFSDWARSRHAPTFADFPATDTGRIKPAPVRLTTHAARTYRTVLREKAREGPNFAGHYTILDLGCPGTCSRLAIINARTGQVYVDTTMYPFQPMHRRDSRLLVLDYTLVDPAHPFIEYIEWTGTRLRLHRRLDAPHISTPSK